MESSADVLPSMCTHELEVIAKVVHRGPGHSSTEPPSTLERFPEDARTRAGSGGGKSLWINT